jgi:UDP-N-acetylglucosamine 1-carboxyvinyltransferase
MEDALIIRGGVQLRGEVELSGSKNIALKVIIAALLVQGEVVLHNVPKIGDVEELLHLLKLLGVHVTHESENTLRIQSGSIAHSEVDLLHGSKIRVSFLLFAPLLHQFGKCRIPNPGGCRLGARSIDRIVEGLVQLGAQVEYDSETGYYDARLDGNPSGTYRFAKPSHTGTELLIMFAALGNSEVVIENAALEPEIDQLILFLTQCGASIMREGSRIVVRGVERLRQTVEYVVAADRNEAVTFATLAVASRGSIHLKNISENDFPAFVEAIRRTGSHVQQNGNGITFARNGDILPVSVVTKPHPGFMTDWQPNWAVLMTQATGESTIHETIFENRFAYVEELLKLGANIEYFQPIVERPSETYQFSYDSNQVYQQAIRIVGPSELHGGALQVHDLRAGATLLIGALIAHGESVITNVQTLDRGYDSIETKIASLGGRIKRV